MPREHARIQVAIWSDPSFRALERDPQRMYLVLLSQHRLSYCGALDYMPNRLASFAIDETEATVENAVKILEHERFVVLDRDTGELLIRSFVRHDRLLESPNMTKAMTKDRAAMLSDHLRAVVDEELIRAYRQRPDIAGWKGLRDIAPELFDHITGKGSAKGSRKGSEKGSTAL